MVHLKMVPDGNGDPKLGNHHNHSQVPAVHLWRCKVVFPRSSQCTQWDSIHPSGIAQINNWMGVPSRNRS